MTVQSLIRDAEQHMQKAIEFLKSEFRGIRTGRASAGLVDGLKVNVAAYGSSMALKELANVGVAEGNTIVIKPYDPSTLKDIERAIETSELGINPQNDGKLIRLPVPPLSTERRNQLVGRVKSLAEQQKVAIRNLRRDANKGIDTLAKDAKISEDEKKKAQDQVQKLTDQYAKKVDELLAEKSKDILEG